jgi:ABC-type microcin C transport system duplicated ATPase subunit YejF
MTIGQILMEGLDIQRVGTRAERIERARAAIEAVELRPMPSTACA